MAKSFLGLVYAVARKKITDMCYQIVTICIFDKLFFEPTFFLLVPKVLTDSRGTKVSNSWLCCHLLLLMIFFSADVCRVQVQRWHMERRTSEGRPRLLSRRVL